MNFVTFFITIEEALIGVYKSDVSSNPSEKCCEICCACSIADYNFSGSFSFRCVKIFFFFNLFIFNQYDMRAPNDLEFIEQCVNLKELLDGLSG